MSAKFFPEDKGWLLSATAEQRSLTNDEEALLSVTFDTQTDQDIKAIEKNIKDTKFLKSVSLYKILTFPIEYFFMVLFFKAEHKNNKKVVTKLYWKFLRNRISLVDFKKELAGYSKSGKII